MAAIGALVGCGPPCNVGEVKCDGNVAIMCAGGDESPVQWSRQDCGTSYCRTTEGTNSMLALCSLGPDPDPACASAPSERSDSLVRCAGSTLIGCQAGYREVVLDQCGSADLCKTFEQPKTSACVVSLDPAPACAAADDSMAVRRVCEGDRELTCYQGYALRARDCGAGLCYTPALSSNPVAQPGPSCVLSRDADPRCSDTSLKLYTYPDGEPRSARGCDGNSLFLCVDGMLTVVQDCAPKKCDRLPGNAAPACEPSQTLDLRFRVPGGPLPR
ncbi:MAG: hypothetical protein ABUS79_13580 [Pseudomonadota bacterium]